MGPSKHEKERKVFDVDTSKHRRDILNGRNVLNLKPKFRIRHPLITLLGAVVVVILVSIGIHQFSTKAEVSDFYPSTCLGNWQNPENAERVPETIAAGQSFNASNSAIFSSTSSQIFCGGFVSPSMATSGDIQSIGLTFIWQVGDTPQSTSTATTTDDEASSSTSTLTQPATDVGTSTATTTDESVSSTDAASATSQLFFKNFLSQLNPFTVALADDSDGDSSDTTVDASTTVLPPPASTPTSTETDTGDDSTPPADASTTIAPSSVATTTVPATTTDQTTSPDTSTTASSTDSTTTPIILPPIIVPLSLGTTSAATSTENASDTASSSPIVVPPPAPDEDFLQVSYSTDGVTWIPLATINENDWQDFTVALPLSTWADLQNVQIKVEGIPTSLTQVPDVYLDSILMEVHYNTSSDSTLTQQAATSTPPVAPPFVPPTPPPPKITVFDPGAQQTCSITPFSQPTLPNGGLMTFTLALKPSGTGVGYNLITGNLPAGISILIQNASGVSPPATTTFSVQAAQGLQSGSINLAIVYQETQSDGSVLANFCQFNLVVP